MAKQHKPQVDKSRTVTTEGVRPPDPEVAAQLMTHAPTPNFYLMAHPSRWGVIAGEFLPILGTMLIEPGVNCVDKRGGVELAKAHARRNGWIVLPHDIVSGGYVRRYPVAKGFFHCTIWEQPIQTGILAVIRRDEKGYNEFLRYLITSGIVPLPEPEVLEALEEMARERLQRLRDAERQNPHRITWQELEIQRIKEMAAIVAGQSPPKWDGPQFHPGVPSTTDETIADVALPEAEPVELPAPKRRKASAPPAVGAEPVAPPVAPIGGEG